MRQGRGPCSLASSLCTALGGGIGTTCEGGVHRITVQGPEQRAEWGNDERARLPLRGRRIQHRRGDQGGFSSTAQEDPMRDPHVNGAHAVDLGSDTAQGVRRSPDRRPQESAPASTLRVSYGAATDRGLRRELNEDSFIAMDPVFAVANGMGGHEAGEVASSICVRTLGASSIIGTRNSQFAAEHLEDLIAQADERIRTETGGQAGTTVSGAVLVEESGQPHWLFFNAGDSRTYRLSNGTFGQISVDHSEVQEMVDRGTISEEEARRHPRRHVITRALGTGDDAEADTWLLPVEENDRLLICSDGLSGELTDEEICTLLSTVRDPQEACDELVAATLRAGARDNVTVLVVDASNTTKDQGASPTRTGTLFAADTDRTPSR